MRDQIIINTQRLSSLERAMDNIQSGALSIRLSVLESRVMEQEQQLENLRQVLYGSLAFAFIQFAALLGFALKAWMNWLSTARQQERNHGT